MRSSLFFSTNSFFCLKKNQWNLLAWRSFHKWKTERMASSLGLYFASLGRPGKDKIKYCFECSVLFWYCASRYVLQACEQAFCIFMEEPEHSENKPTLFWVPDNISEARILDNISNFFSTKPASNCAIKWEIQEVDWTWCLRVLSDVRHHMPEGSFSW